MDANHLVTMAWWVGGIECVFILVMIKFIFDEKNRLK
jgi:putative copper export protein